LTFDRLSLFFICYVFIPLFLKPDKKGAFLYLNLLINIPRKEDGDICNPKEVRSGIFRNQMELNHKLFILEGDS
jgi:hypothetical protein